MLNHIHTLAYNTLQITSTIIVAQFYSICCVVTIYCSVFLKKNCAVHNKPSYRTIKQLARNKQLYVTTNRHQINACPCADPGNYGSNLPRMSPSLKRKYSCKITQNIVL